MTIIVNMCTICRFWPKKKLKKKLNLELKEKKQEQILIGFNLKFKNSQSKKNIKIIKAKLNSLPE